MVIFEDAKYDDFVEVAIRVDPALMKKRKEKLRKKSMASASTSTVSKDSRQSTSQSSSQSRRFRPSNSNSKHSPQSKKPIVKDARMYRDAALGKPSMPKLEAPSWVS